MLTGLVQQPWNTQPRPTQQVVAAQSGGSIPADHLTIAPHVFPGVPASSRQVLLPPMVLSDALFGGGLSGPVGSTPATGPDSMLHTQQAQLPHHHHQQQQQQPQVGMQQLPSHYQMGRQLQLLQQQQQQQEAATQHMQQAAQWSQR